MPRDSSSEQIYRRLVGGVVLFLFFLALAWLLPTYVEWTDHASFDKVYHMGLGIGLALGLFMGPVVSSQIQETFGENV